MRGIISILLILSVFSYALDYEKIKDAYYRSYQYEKVGDFENAVKSIMIVYKEYPEGYTVNLRLGWLYYLNKNYANSIYHYEKALKVIPSSVEAKLGYTLPLLAQGKYTDVEKICYQILNTDFYNYYGNLRLSFVLRMQKKYDMAVKVINKMLSLYPTDINFLTELALVRFYQGDKKQAEYLFKDILILDPENVTAKEYLKKLR
ncbi:MAG TPA: tetratricopeptide repeat protein [Persephonella sp.]|uniref:Tetratricopeptide repeat domain protein n=1 Tax=Persephonella marina (strain DSM 14350 / EX-H1) TaxID=123214 RepID=C0QPS8_PERMH|nr:MULTISPECIES: tetratricopeptide repeat protein [Persephonella]ACO03642.1 tetratricopeptide repeat domain protein [Persephonella marina EX-H1]HCB69711.1 tetratricopeptide repeat protein [Persephonella sp.]